MTTCDHLGKSSKHPIYLTLGNIPSWVRNKPDAKVLLGYLLRLKAKTNSQKNSRKFKFAKCSLYQYTLDVLTRVGCRNLYMPKYVSDSAMSKPSFGIIFNLPKSQTRN